MKHLETVGTNIGSVAVQQQMTIVVNGHGLSEFSVLHDNVLQLDRKKLYQGCHKESTKYLSFIVHLKQVKSWPRLLVLLVLVQIVENIGHTSVATEDEHILE